MQTGKTTMGKTTTKRPKQTKNIEVIGARVHNLKNVNVTIPRNKFVVITGLSGSGKSSLAFDTLYAEGQRRYVESLSAYARQFLGRFDKPDVDTINGISPAIAIEQKVNTRNPRSTVGTTTEIYDYLKLLFTRIGKTISPVSGNEVKKHSVTDVLNFINQLPKRSRLLITSPLINVNREVNETLELIQKDIKTLEKAVYSGSIEINNNTSNLSNFDNNSEDVLTRHLLKLSEIENQFQQLTNKFEEINFKLDKLSNRLSKVQADNQVRFQDLEAAFNSGEAVKNITKNTTQESILPGSSTPQDLGSVSYKDTLSNETTQKIESVETTASIVTETFQAEEKILPNDTPDKQYEFATSFLKVGDYPTAERAFREFVLSNPEHQLAGNAQYWYAETFRIRQLYTDAAAAYLEGYQKYPQGEKAPVNLLKLGVSMVQIGEKDQGCKMINGVEKQYPKANQSVIQKAKYESQKFECNQNS